MLEKFHICDDLDFCLSQLDHKFRLAVAISREYSHNSRLTLACHYHCFEKSEIIYEYALKFLVRRNFPYFNELNRFIQMASSSGLIEKWRSTNQNPFDYKEMFFGYLTFDYFLGIVILGSILWILLIVFIFVERIVHTKNREPNPSQFWVIFEMVIDPDRHFMLDNKYFGQ